MKPINKFRKYSYFDDSPSEHVPGALLYIEGAYYKIGSHGFVYVWRDIYEWVKATITLEEIKKVWKRQFLNASKHSDKKSLAEKYINTGEYATVTPARAANKW